MQRIDNLKPGRSLILKKSDDGKVVFFEDSLYGTDPRSLPDYVQNSFFPKLHNDGALKDDVERDSTSSSENLLEDSDSSSRNDNLAELPNKGKINFVEEADEEIDYMYSQKESYTL